MSWAVLPVSVAQVRGYFDVTGTTGKYDEARITSNIKAAASFLQRRSLHQFEPQTATTKYFTSEGRASLAIPDLRTASAISLQGAALTVDESYWLIGQDGISTTLQFRAFGSGYGASYLSNPQWFDRNLDRWGTGGSLPNDLAITGDWGYDPYPDEFLHAVTVLAAWYTRRPQSLLADVQFTAEGNVFNYANFPPEVVEFLKSWRAGSQMVAV